MYYKHKDLDSYIMVTPSRVIKTYGDSVIQYAQKDYGFRFESDINTDFYKPIPEHEFRFAFIQVLETLTHTLKTINDAEITIN